MITNSKIYFDKINDLYIRTMDSDYVYDNKLLNIDYFSILYDATRKDQMIKFKDSTIIMFNYKYENEDSLLIICLISIFSDNNTNLHISEKVMETVKILESYFVTIDYMDCKQVKEDNFVYITAVKKLGEKKEDE